MSLSAVDWVAVCVFAILAFGFIGGVGRGLFGATLDILAFAFAVQMACRHYEYVSGLIRFALNTNPHHSRLLGFVVVFVAMSVVAETAASLLARLARGADGLIIDRVLGGVLGVAKTYVTVALILWLILSAPLEALVPHVTRSGVSMAIVRSVPSLLSSTRTSLFTHLDHELGRPVDPALR